MAGIDERRARAEGDVVRSALAPTAGALIGGALLVWLRHDALSTSLNAWAKDAFAGGTPVPSLWAACATLVQTAWPVLAGAFIGALVTGLLQTRGYLGAPATQVRIAEPARPALPLSLAAGVVLLAMMLLALRSVVTLQDAEPRALVAGAAIVGANVVRTLLLGLLAIAFVDHLLRSRARSVRLDNPHPRTRTWPVAESADLEALLDDAALVLFDDELTIVFAPREGSLVLSARVKGLSARALIDAARRRGVRLRSGDAFPYSTRSLGTSPSEYELRALGLAS